jgi:hypothetical protein
MLAEKFITQIEEKYRKALENDNQSMIDKCEVLIVLFKKLKNRRQINYFIKKYGT